MLSASVGQATTESLPARHLAVATPSQQDQLHLHLDLASTPPEPYTPNPPPTGDAARSAGFSQVAATTPAPVGRAPPTL
ncbi:hypothetical protein [Aeromicrobium sp. UC242_57]|uniref:hypothetical protein n=1 Tax=Aeromicrobium sp. UC242_57 TaxID=3374624 RepID=UPI0037886870